MTLFQRSPSSQVDRVFICEGSTLNALSLLYFVDAFLSFSSRSFAFSHVLQTRRRLYLRSNNGDSSTVIDYTVFHGGGRIRRSQDTDSACTEPDYTTYSDWVWVLVCSVFPLHRVMQVDSSG